ncbi:GMC oxidoreductase family protein Mala s 12 [Psilocybe cubensis]|uniref:GMC oxidoreductase family protein Mala s 12 n=1 Tax=Psilocybe cubensis TaxID=181762 RepID=A0ACB8H605_PSICU|nr:GMC oxidoreductase family protein Mala s 12 [Psilocybe cubensis]KAH9483223.1 GMC oxidoreductase family protein Mala s 12 [Psilocybe cubensis]
MSATIEQVSGQSFDYVIVGASTAGLVLANRLTEDESVSVLVLEAGAANLGDPALLTPATFGSQFGNPQYEWGYATEPQAHSNNRSVPWPRGKGLGGSSGINFFQYHMPTVSDLDAFEKLGNSGWNWDLIKKYQKKSERFVPPAVKTETMNYDLSVHGTDGPLVTSYVATESGIEKPYHDALANLGVQRSADATSGNHNGTFLTHMTIDPQTHVRTYAANAYYAPVAHRKNLTVLTLARAAQIESTTSADGLLTATGVEFIYEDARHSAFAKKEVVLSAGSIVDPQLLELSGIGNKEILNKFEIPVKLEIPGVGSNIQEHIHAGATFEISDEKKDEVLTFDCLRDPAELGKQMVQFMTDGTGVFGMGLSMMSMLPLSKISPNAEQIYADLEKSLEEGIAANRYTPLQQKQYKLQLETLRKGQPNCETLLAQAAQPIPGIAEDGKKYLSLSSLLNNPFSRGSIHIRSTNPLDHPSMDPHLFEEEYDLRILVEMFKWNRRVVQTEPLKSFVKQTEVFPGPQVQTDEQIANHIKNTISTVYHTIGSCSMLPLADGGVVDTKLKVYNTSNLRVVDVSIVPLHVTAHVQAIAFAIGEIGADIIKGKL